jgi:hypothetical protein
MQQLAIGFGVGGTGSDWSLETGPSISPPIEAVTPRPTVRRMAEAGDRAEVQNQPSLWTAKVFMVLLRLHSYLVSRSRCGCVHFGPFGYDTTAL